MAPTREGLEAPLGAEGPVPSGTRPHPVSVFASSQDGGGRDRDDVGREVTSPVESERDPQRAPSGVSPAGTASPVALIGQIETLLDGVEARYEALATSYTMLLERYEAKAREVDRLTSLVTVLRPLAESDPCWTVDSVCGYCEGHAYDTREGSDYHKPDCEWLKAHAALQSPVPASPVSQETQA
jgi:hypothetical protein